MNNTLLIIPTLLEAEHILDSNLSVKQTENLYSLPALNTDLLICGPGLPVSMMRITQHLASENAYTLMLLAGIAGSYSDSFQAGDLLVVETEKFADIGYMYNGQFVPLTNSKTWKDYRRGVLINEYQVLRHETGLKNVSANTVNLNNANLKGMPDADIENMEGAGFFLLAKEVNIPYLEIRSVSNPVTERNKKKWETNLALGKLTWFLNTYLKRRVS
jgi:futalosine hydrolase